MSGATKDVSDFVTDKVLYGLARRTKIFARIKFTRFFREHFADGGSHGKAQIRVNVHFRATHAARNLDVGSPARLARRASCRHIC